MNIKSKDKKDSSQIMSKEDPIENEERFLNIELHIRDNGCGISEEGLKHLFIDFGKLHENEERNSGGTGLGLSICKKIIEQMGGNVRVESEEHVGTTFIVSLSLKCKVSKARLT